MFGRVVLLVVASLAIAQDSSSCFPSCEPLQCTGVYGPREGSQERWTETVKYVKAKVPSAHIDDRIVMAPGRFGYEVTVAADSISRGEILLRLPVETFLLEEDCFPTEGFARLGIVYNSSLKILPNITWNTSKTNGADFTQAGLCLLIHRLLGNESAFAGYLRHLPRQSSDQTYMFRPMSEIEVLKGTESFRIASAIKRRLAAQLDKSTDEGGFAMIREYFPALNWTVEEFRAELLQTLSLCGSRTFNLDSGMLLPEKPAVKPAVKLYRPALIPLLDMLNHGDARTRNCQYFFNTTAQHFQLQAIRDIHLGEELIHSYGPRCNAELLLFYGFTMDGNTEDFVSVVDLTQGALDYNYHTRLGHSPRCHTPYFRPVEGSGWPPKFQSVIAQASADEKPSYVSLGPLKPSTYRSFKAKLEPPVAENVQKTFADLARHPGALLRIAEGEFAVTYDDDTNATVANETLPRGNLTVELQWKTSMRAPSCVVSRPKCERFLPNVNSVTAILNLLQEGRLPDVARAGGCYVRSEAKKSTYEVKLAGDSSWTAVVIDPPPEGSLDTADAEAHEAEMFNEFQYKRHLIQAVGLEAYSTKLFRTGLLPEMLFAVRLAVLPSLSSYAVHGILSGSRFPPEFEQQVARTLMMFCFEELTRRLQVLGVDTDEESFPDLMDQARAMVQSRVESSYGNLARNEVGIVVDFCSGIAEWGMSLWERGI